MLSRISLPSIKRIAAPLALAVLFSTTPTLGIAAPTDSGSPAPQTRGTLSTGALVSAALAVGQDPARKAAPQTVQGQQSKSDVSLRASLSRDSEVIKDLVYNADGRTPAYQRQPFELSLLEAVEIALRNNLSVQVARYGPQNSVEGINSARAPFDTNLSFNIPSAYSRGTSPSTSQIQGGDIITQQGLGGGFTWSENLEWGTNYSLSAGDRAAARTNNEFSHLQPELLLELATARSARTVAARLRRRESHRYPRGHEQLRSEPGKPSEARCRTPSASVVQAYWQLRCADGSR